MRDRRRLLALLLCAGLLLALSVSSAFIVLEAGHACRGNACEICETMARIEALLYGTAWFALFSLFAACLLPVLKAYRAVGAARRPAFSTLVCWKIRLNN